MHLPALPRELGVPLASVSGTGPGGRVTKADVMRHAEEVRQQAAAAAAAEPGGGAAAAAGPGDRAVAAAAAVAPQRSLSELMAAYQQVAAAAAGAGSATAAGGGEAAAGQVVPLKGYRRCVAWRAGGEVKPRGPFRQASVAVAQGMPLRRLVSCSEPIPVSPLHPALPGRR